MTAAPHVLPREAEGPATTPNSAVRSGFTGSSIFGAGDLVEIRSKEEILATLDANGELESMPFMPEMLQYCGQRFRVYKRAHKSCDTVSGAYKGLKLENAVHLSLRCDGSAHGGCQAGCLLFWKDDWLKPVEVASSPAVARPSPRRAGCTEQQLLDAVSDGRPPEQRRYSCQATRLLAYTATLKWWRFGQYLEDFTSGNASPSEMWHSFAYATYVTLTMAHRRTLGKPGRWLYDRFQKLRGGLPFPAKKGKFAVNQVTPCEPLNLQPGELVRVKSYAEILATLNITGGNGRLQFDAEMVPSCGKTYRVLTRIDKFVDEKNGLLHGLKRPAIILEDAVCRGCYSHDRMMCPRSIYSWWREVWLERVPENSDARQ
ncbi:hypothetical protein [Aminobacter sp. Piv2-1]|uniref:hypothetical protein n=1 Tax=Aminobacter sp. Piv2-1 TaxID=3031122 RepID=UPI0030AC03A0